MRSDIDQMGIRELLFDPALSNQMYDHAKVALQHARSLAPTDSGEYRRRMFVRRLRGGTAGAIYGTQSYKGWWVEYGTVNHRAHHVLTRAAQAANLKVRHHSTPGGGPLS